MSTAVKPIYIGDFEADQEILDAVTNVMKSGRITEHKEVEKFEKEYAKYIGTESCVAVSSGTGALFTIFQGLKEVFPASKVLTTPFTYTATVNAPSMLGFELDFVDINEDNYGLNMDLVNERMETEDIDILLPVHLLGYPVNLKKLKQDCIVVEDCCEAAGSTYENKMVGSFGYAGAFSFYISHNINVGEMGAITTNAYFAHICNLVKDNGRDYKNYPRQYVHMTPGFNFKTTEVMAVIANIQLKRAPQIIKKRQEIAKFFADELSSVNGITAGKYDNRSSYLGYPIVSHVYSSQKISRELMERKIESRQMFPLIYEQPAFEHLRKDYINECPVAERISKMGLYIPCHQYINEEQAHYIVKSIKEVVK